MEKPTGKKKAQTPKEGGELLKGTPKGEEAPGEKRVHKRPALAKKHKEASLGPEDEEHV